MLCNNRYHIATINIFQMLQSGTKFNYKRSVCRVPRGTIPTRISQCSGAAIDNSMKSEVCTSSGPPTPGRRATVAVQKASPACGTRVAIVGSRGSQSLLCHLPGGEAPEGEGGLLPRGTTVSAATH